MATITYSKSEKLKIGIKKYLTKSFYNKRMKKWNKTGKIKSILIFVFSVFPLFFFDYNKNKEFLNDYYLMISVFIFLFITLFLPLVTKFWSLVGIEIKKPNWNESPISFGLSKGLNFFQFCGYWFITSGIIKLLFTGIFSQEIDSESIILFSYGIGALTGIKLSVKWLNLEGNKTKKTVANTV